MTTYYSIRLTTTTVDDSNESAAAANGGSSSQQPRGDVDGMFITASSLATAAACPPPQSLWPELRIELPRLTNSSDLASMYPVTALASYMPFLQEGGRVHVSLPANADLKLIHTSFLLAGLTLESERRNNDGVVVLTATKKKAFGVTTATTAVSLNAKTATKENDLIDEDDLLDDALLAPPPAMTAANTKDDCGGREPCADCTCGRRDNNSSAEQPTAITTSACGKCGLGDAFRCASCPYLGKPAFKAGEEHLVLDLQDDL